MNFREPAIKNLPMVLLPRDMAVPFCKVLSEPVLLCARRRVFRLWPNISSEIKIWLSPLGAAFYSMDVALACLKSN
jgi:hypothetical protein